MPGGGGPGTGAGSAGTCFSGGSGSGGTYYPVEATTYTLDAGSRGGAGSDSAILGAVPEPPQSAAGAGNPNGNTNPSVPTPLFNLYDGTGGVLIVFVEGTITTAGPSVKHFSANGTFGRQMETAGMNGTTYPFGGGTGGGIVILVNNSAVDLSGNVQALGGIVSANGPAATPTNYRSGGNGAAVTYTFGQL